MPRTKLNAKPTRRSNRKKRQKTPFDAGPKVSKEYAENLKKRENKAKQGYNESRELIKKAQERKNDSSSPAPASSADSLSDISSVESLDMDWPLDPSDIINGPVTDEELDARYGEDGKVTVTDLMSGKICLYDRTTAITPPPEPTSCPGLKPQVSSKAQLGAGENETLSESAYKSLMKNDFPQGERKETDLASYAGVFTPVQDSTFSQQMRDGLYANERPNPRVT